MWLTWQRMLTRCYNPNVPRFIHYGGRGIRVADRWFDFDTFCSDMGRPPTLEHSLDRVDNDKGYSPGNCHWATAKEQSLNRSNNTRISYGGETLSLSEWSERTGISQPTLCYRLSAGWSLERVLTTPTKGKK
jgi:hypothetical protein